MKATLFVVSLIFLMKISFGQTHIYYPFPTSNTTWRESSNAYSGFCSDYQDFITGDTIINGDVYSKIQRFGVQYELLAGNCTNDIIATYNEYRGAYRNDSVNKKVWFIPANEISDTLLYDFNLNINDSLPASFLYNPLIGMNSYVSQIDSMLIGMSYHQRFWISSSTGINQYMYLVEGIGSDHGLLANIFPQFEDLENLLCVIQEGYTIYPNATTQCDLVTEILSTPNPIIPVSLYPNPASEYVKIDFENTTKNIDVEIFDLLGVKKLSIENIGPNFNVNISNLDSGLYLYQIYHNRKEAYWGKLIKVK
jgi:hypothetical protein